MSDDALLQAVRAELEHDPEVNARHVGVSVVDGAVLLTGYVPLDDEKRAAVRAAERVDGVEAVADELDVQRLLPGEFTDAEIAEEIAHRRARNPEIPTSVAIEVREGHATLRGEVDSAEQRAVAEHMVRNLLGIRSVDNEVVVRS
jgi:osmotically-inducible protein OsmY